MLTPSEITSLGEACERRAASVVDGIVGLVARMAADAFAAGDESVPSASGVPQAVLAYLAAHPVERAEEVEEEEECAEGRSDRNDASALGVAVAALALSALGSRSGGTRGGGAGRGVPRPTGANLTGTGADYIEREVRAFLQRANLNMAADAQRTYRRVVAEGIRRYKAGMENYERAMTRMCREIARAGVSSVSYRSGARAQADVAVRRHVQGMVRKAADERTLDAALRLGYKLVEVSSHGGARPSHRRWQGKVYSLVGDIEIDGVHYKDFYRETGYGSVDGLGGANCRHSFAPYTPGRPRRWAELDEEAEDRAYKLSQEQRANEREIRAWKREAMACRAAGVDDTDARLGLGRAQKKQREFLAAHPELQRRPGREHVFEPDGSTARVDALTKKESGATSGALNDRNDPDMKRRDRHAASYYEEVRRRDTDAEVSRVSRNSGVDAGIVRKAYEHVFIDEHDLADGRHRFIPDYDMSQSWQRLSTGKGIQEHDVTLLRHEEAEARFMAGGMSYDEAHRKACEMGYDYPRELQEWKLKGRQEG